MIPDNSSGLSNVISCSIIDEASIRKGDMYMLISNCQEPPPEEVDCLNIKVIKKMMLRFLIELKMTKEELAKVLGITTRNLNQLFSQKVSEELIKNINLPLIKLYCKTKWI